MEIPTKTNLIITPRLHINVYTAETISELLAILNEDDFKHTLGLTSKEEYRKYKLRYNSGNDYLSFRIFVLREPVRNQLVGSFSYHVWIPQHRKAEIGYRILDGFQKQRLAIEAMRAVLTHGFEAMNLNRVEAFIGPENAASQKLVKRYGFTQEGTLRENYLRDNIAEDSICFSLLQKEYNVLKENW